MGKLKTFSKNAEKTNRDENQEGRGSRGFKLEIHSEHYKYEQVRRNKEQTKEKK